MKILRIMVGSVYAFFSDKKFIHHWPNNFKVFIFKNTVYFLFFTLKYFIYSYLIFFNYNIYLFFILIYFKLISKIHKNNFVIFDLKK